LNENLKISIVTATFNSEKTVVDTLESVLSQRYPNTEHIIKDGRSSDNTLQKLIAYPHITKVISEADDGIYDAMNKGINIATGDLIGILNSDDLYENENVLNIVADVFKEKNVDAVYGDLVYTDPHNTNKVIRTWKAGKYHKSKWLRGWMPPHPTFFVRRKIYEKYGLFDLDLKSSADYEIMLRFLYKHDISVAYLDKTLVKMRAGGQSNATLKNRIKANKEDRLAWEKNGLRPPFYTTYFKPIRKIPQFFKKKI